MVGIDFKIPNEYGRYLSDILSSVDVTQYTWANIADDIILTMNPPNNMFFDGNLTLDGKEFLEGVEKQDNYYILFADFKAFPLNSSPTPIKSFSDFVESDCQIIINIYDSYCVSVYSKDKSILETVHGNCIKYGYTDVKLLSEEDVKNRTMIAF